jgi:hypothetical protein
LSVSLCRPFLGRSCFGGRLLYMALSPVLAVLRRFPILLCLDAAKLRNLLGGEDAVKRLPQNI